MPWWICTNRVAPVTGRGYAPTSGRADLPGRFVLAGLGTSSALRMGMLAVALKLLFALAVLVMPGGFLVVLGATFLRRIQARQPLALSDPRRARIPAGVMDQNFSRSCPSPICYRP